MRCYQRALSIFEPHAANHSALAEILVDLGRTDEALLHAERAYKLDAKLPLVHRHWPGGYKCPAKAAATKLLTAAIDQTPGNAATICALSRCLTAGGQLDQALRNYASRSPPRQKKATTLGDGRGDFAKINCTTKQKPPCDEPLSFNPRWLRPISSFHKSLSGKERRTNRFRLAAALHYSPQSVDAILHLAELLRESEEPAEAERSIGRRWNFGQTRRKLRFVGAALIEQGRPPEAIQQFDQAIQIRPITPRLIPIARRRYWQRGVSPRAGTNTSGDGKAASNRAEIDRSLNRYGMVRRWPAVRFSSTASKDWQMKSCSPLVIPT